MKIKKQILQKFNSVKLLSKLNFAKHLRKKGQILAVFWPLFKDAIFEYSKYESFVRFIMPKHSSDGNFLPFCA